MVNLSIAKFAVVDCGELCAEKYLVLEAAIVKISHLGGR